MEKNEEYIGIVEKTGSNGEGILKNGDYTVFVPYALPEEKIKYKVLKVKKNICFAKLIELYVPSEERVRPKCRVYEKCGGCQLQHLKYKHPTYVAIGSLWVANICAFGIFLKTISA